MSSAAPLGLSLNSPAHRSLLLTVLVAGQTIIAMDFSLASVAIPSIARELSVAPTIAQWVVSAMSLAFGGFLIVGGRLADIYGQKKCLIAGLALYTIGALGSGVSGAIGPLICCRALQGVGGAMMFPATLSLIFLNFQDGPARFRALTISMAVQFLASPVGVIFAGVLYAALGWRGAFLFSVPIGLTCIALAPMLIADVGVAHERKQPVDYLGAVLSTLACALLVWTLPALIAQGAAVSTATLSGFAASLMVSSMFVVLQRRVKVPLVSGEVLRYKNLVPGMIVAALIPTSLAGMVGVGLIGMQQGLHFTPLEAGFGLLPYGVMSLLVSLMAPKASRYVLQTPRASLIAALLLVGSCHMLISVAPVSARSFDYLALALLLAPIGGILGLNIAMSEALKSVRVEFQGVASALLYAVMQIGVAVGVSVMITASYPGKLGPGTPESLAAYTGSFRIGAIVCLIGIGFCLVIRPPTSIAGKMRPDMA